MKTLVTFFILLFIYSVSYSQNKGFESSKDLFGTKVFVKNNGQFNKEIPNEASINFGYVNATEKVFLQKKAWCTNLLNKPN